MAISSPSSLCYSLTLEPSRLSPDSASSSFSITSCRSSSYQRLNRKLQFLQIESAEYRFLLPTGFLASRRTFSSYDDSVVNSYEMPILVCFTATWSAPCQFMIPILDEVGAALGDEIHVVEMDFDLNRSMSRKYKVKGLPTLMIFRNGKPYFRFEGAMTAAQLIQCGRDFLKMKFPRKDLLPKPRSLWEVVLGDPRRR